MCLLLPTFLYRKRRPFKIAFANIVQYCLGRGAMYVPLMFLAKKRNSQMYDHLGITLHWTVFKNLHKLLTIFEAFSIGGSNRCLDTVFLPTAFLDAFLDALC